MLTCIPSFVVAVAFVLVLLNCGSLAHRSDEKPAEKCPSPKDARHERVIRGLFKHAPFAQLCIFEKSSVMLQCVWNFTNNGRAMQEFIWLSANGNSAKSLSETSWTNWRYPKRENEFTSLTVTLEAEHHSG